MSENKPLDLNQVMQNIGTIFQNVDKKDFLKRLINNDNFWDLLDNNSKQELERLIELMVNNARVAETRKLQQQFFYPVLTTINQDDVKTQFENNINFQNSFLALAVIFLAGFHAMSHKDASHHDFIEENIKKAIAKIVD